MENDSFVGIPKVSIVIPVYNGAKYVTQAIDSALRQTYKNKEIIVVNDGSTDETDELCKSYGDLIKYISKENGGVSSALNVGIKNMTGEYFSWLSHDDLYYPDKVEKQIAYIINYGIDDKKTILYSNYTTVNATGDFVKNIIFDNVILNRDSAFSILKGAINGITLLIPKEAFDDIGFFDENLRCVQDYKLWFEMYKHGYRFVHMEDVLAITRLHSEQVSNTSPRVRTEGNIFWKEVINSFDDSKKTQLFGSIYEFYYYFTKFFYGGPYTEAMSYCMKQCKQIEKNNQKKIADAKVSIIIWLEKNIDRCFDIIESILKQTHKNIEIIISSNAVDIDFTKIESKVSNVENKIQILKYVEKKNRNEIWKDCITQATGDYVVLINENSDMECDRIEKQLTKMVSSQDCPISGTSYYEIDENKKILVNCGFEDGYIVHKLINCCYYKMPVIMIKKEYLINNEIYDCSEFDNIIMKCVVDNRILGIMEPLVEIHKNDEVIDMKSRFSNIVHFVTENKQFLKYDNEVGELVEAYSNLLKSKKSSDDNSYITKYRMDTIERYKYMQTNEYKTVKKYRNVINRLIHRKNVPEYLVETKDLKNNKINSIYRTVKGDKKDE